MRSGSGRLLGLLLAMGIGLGAEQAAALGISPNPVDLLGFEDELVARVTLVGTATGTPAGGITLAGAAAPSDETLLFTVEYVAQSIGPLAMVGVQRSGGVWSALGWVPGADVDWSSAIYPTLNSLAAIASWALDTGLTSDVFFVSASNLPAGTTLAFGLQGYHGVPYGQGSATIVPEPTTLALLAGGLALLSRAARRR